MALMRVASSFGDPSLSEAVTGAEGFEATWWS